MSTEWPEPPARPKSASVGCSSRTANARDPCFILLRGEIRLSAAAAHFLSDANPGDCIGLLSVMKGTYAMRAENTSMVVLRVIPRSALLEVIRANEDVRSSIQRYIEAFGQRVGEPLELPRIGPSHGVAGR